MSGPPMPYVVPQFFDVNGTIAAGYKLFTYEAGTSKLATTWANGDLSTPNANPIVLDSAGRANIFLNQDSAYKFVMVRPDETTGYPTGPMWTATIIAPVPDVGMSSTESRAGKEEEISTSGTVQTIALPYRAGTVVYNKYVNAVATVDEAETDEVSIPAGSLSTDDDCLILEWEIDNTSVVVTAGVEGSLVDTLIPAIELGTAAASTFTRARFVITRVQNSCILDMTVMQNTGGGAVQVAGLVAGNPGFDFDANDYAVKMLGTTGDGNAHDLTIRGARVTLTQAVLDWTLLT